MITEEQNQLRALEQGFIKSEIAAVETAQLVQAVVNTSPKTQVIQIGKPVEFSTINFNNLVDDNDDVIEFNFTNNTGAAQLVYFSALFGQPGSAVSFNLPPSAVDFPDFLENNSDDPSFGGVLKGFLKRAESMPILVNNFMVQTDNLAQSNQKLIVGRITKTLNKMENSIVPSLCDACYNNNDNAYTKEFKGTFAIGLSNYLGYRINIGATVMIRMNVLAEHSVSTQSAQGTSFR